MPAPRVLLVGHCRPDSHALKSAVRRALAGAEVEFISDDHDLSARLPGAALLLVNRVLDGEFPDPGGVELIARTARAGVPAILISNFPDAQAAAQAAGARPGFGKNAMNSEQAGEMIRAAAKI